MFVRLVLSGGVITGSWEAGGFVNLTLVHRPEDRKWSRRRCKNDSVRQRIVLRKSTFISVVVNLLVLRWGAL